MRTRNSAACSNQATSGTAMARKTPATAELPSSQVQPRDEHAEGEQRQHHAAQCVAGGEAANIAEVDEIHGHEHRRPLGELDRNRLDPPATMGRAGQPYGDAKKRGDRSHDHPILSRGPAKKARPADAKDADGDNGEIGRLRQQADPPSAPPRLSDAVGRRRIRIGHHLLPLGVRCANPRCLRRDSYHALSRPATTSSRHAAAARGRPSRARAERGANSADQFRAPTIARQKPL